MDDAKLDQPEGARIDPSADRRDDGRLAAGRHERLADRADVGGERRRIEDFAFSEGF